MPLWIRLLAAAVVCLAATAGWARAIWWRNTAKQVARLLRNAGAGITFTPELLGGLPAPVARYFRFALTPGRSLVRTARLSQKGEFALRPGKWVLFRAEDPLSAHPAGFVWDAEIRMLPLLPVLVRDSYQSVSGMMVPLEGEVAWILNGRSMPYWRGRIVKAEYRF